MSQNFYECLFLLDSNKYARDASSVSQQLNETIENCDGKIQASRLWNEQRLAYPVNGQRKGTYWLTYFRMAPDRLAELNRACQLNPVVLRHMVIKHDERLAETLVAHALGQTVAAPPADQPDASAASDVAKKAPAEAVAADVP